MIKKPRGTMDILPEEVSSFLHIENTARSTASNFGFREIRFPCFEATELFSRGVGNSTDVVQKEMYTFTDREGRSLTLRPEGTASVVRSMIENGRCSGLMPDRLFYLINCFRYEKPQAGRSREFFQFGAEIFGSAFPLADASLISLADSVISSLGISDTELHINSIGCPSCRPGYRDALVKYFSSRSDELCESCRARLNTNPMRILDCKSPVCSEISQGAPRTLDYLCDDCRTHFDTLCSYLDAQDIKYKVDPSIVRGLDYYTRTVFEFICPVIGAQSTICGGGRYDGLVSELGGPELPACGFAMGITRLILAMKASGAKDPDVRTPAVYFATLGEKARACSLSITRKLRERGIYADCDTMGRSLKAQMKYADKTGARFTVILGDAEAESGRAILRDMADSSQTELEIDSIADFIAKAESI